MSEDDIAPLASLSRADVEALMAARHPDPFAILGPHRDPAGHGTLVRAFLPGALSVRVEGHAQPDAAVALSAIAQTGLFEGAIGTDAPGVASAPYRLVIQWPGERVQETEDPYSFKTLLTDFELHLIAEGRHRELASCLGAQVKTIDGVTGLRFAVWAPNASRVSVVGDFNAWDGRRHPMRLRHSAGVWELFVPRLAPGERYKYELVSREGHLLPQKADPLARMTEHPPATASIATAAGPYAWTDEAWCTTRTKRQSLASPLSIYEVHAASWLAAVNDPVCGWARLAERLIPYACEMGFSHIELLPVMEHPFGGSWGYQPLGQFAPTARFGRPQDFARFVDACHAAGLGVILDWVPAHFPTDAHGLYQFDGSALYEYADPREGVHRDWNTAIYNFGRNEVRGFLIASALFWLEEFHIDGLRVDAVASMLYRDYSRAAGEWLPNRFGGRENLEAIAFLRELNEVVAARCPGALMIAEESTAWPGVTAALADGGLGFTYKWNMGWMHDTLRYLAHDPVHRSWHHHDMSFALVYAYSERFILPLSHDEVVHGKKSLLEKMPGDAWQRFANLRAYLGFMWGHPGKKLLFMGDEIAQPGEWNHDHEIRWDLLADPAHGGVQRLVADLNAMLNALGALFERDHLPEGFAWVVGDDARNSVYAFLRPGGGLARSPDVLVVSNFTPVPHTGYRVGVPRAGVWTERLNTDAFHYGGSNVGNAGAVTALAEPSHGHPYSLVLTLPPLATLFLVSP